MSAAVERPRAGPDLRELLKKLTLEEKVGLLSGADWWRTVRIDREGVFVPQIKVSDGPNGARGESYVSGVRAACFPSESTLGGTFDTDLIYRIGQAFADECKSKSASVLLAPTLNVVRSPLGGRNHETYGEDPFLLGKLGAACVNGLQSRGIGATPKHFVANEAENLRRTLDVRIRDFALRELYLYPFQLVLRESDPWCFMTSYNSVQGQFVGASKRLVTDILRKEWGFKGLVMSDWAGTYSCKEPMNAGMDLEMPGPTQQRGKKLLAEIANGGVSVETVDEAAYRVLELIKRAGKWEDPTEKPEYEASNPARDELICQAAAEGAVLLKNNGVLPISKQCKVAAIGQHAEILAMHGGGSARIFPISSVNCLQGLTNAGINFTYSRGVPVYNAVPLPDPDVVHPCGEVPSIETPVKCEWFNSRTVGENHVRTTYLKRPEYMIKEVWPSDLNEVNYSTRMEFFICPKTTGDHILGVTSTGEADIYVEGELVYHREQEMDLIFESYVFHKNTLTRHITYPMKAGQKYKITLHSKGATEEALSHLRGSQLGSMTLLEGSSIRFYEAYSVSERISEAADLASESDVALVFVGKNDEFESEGYDQEIMALPCHQVDLIEAVAAANPNTVVINFSGSPVEMSFADSVAAILQAWFPGQEGGNAVAKLLTGEITPCGKLASSFPYKIEDNPSFGNFPADKETRTIHYAEGRDVGYRHYDRDDTPNARFPFGFGLSYTTFEYTSFAFVPPGTPPVLSSADASLRLTIQVRNTGAVKGKEIVQVYVSPPVSQVEVGVSGGKRPVKELKGFAKVEVPPGETKEVEISLDKYSVSYWDEGVNGWKAEKGTYKALVAKSSVDIVGSLEFEVGETFVWNGV
ncbi:hypothetical protein VTO42DRAFT_1787 [Malbranchea cinnamomea]